MKNVNFQEIESKHLLVQLNFGHSECRQSCEHNRRVNGIARTNYINKM